MSGSITIPASIQIPAFEIPDDRVAELKTLADRFEAAVDRFERSISEQTVSYSEDEAACKLGISEITLRKIRAARRIAFTPVGRKARYTNKHLSDYLDKNTKAPNR